MARTQIVSEESRAAVVDIAVRVGFRIELKAGGYDRYVKVMKLKHPISRHPVYIQKDRGVTPDGRFDSYRVLVHPDQFVPGLDRAGTGISLPVNRRTGANLFFSSNYLGLLLTKGSEVPCGRAYEARDLASLESLLMALVH